MSQSGIRRAKKATLKAAPIEVDPVPTVGLVDEATILTLLSQDCGHRNSYSYHADHASLPCVKACQLISQGVNSGQVFTNNLVNIFFKRVVEISYQSYYYRDYCCISKIPDLICNTISQLVSTTVPSDEALETIIKKPVLDKCFDSLVSTNQLFTMFSNNLIKKAIEYRFEHGCSDKEQSPLADALLNHCDISTNLIDLVKCRDRSISAKIAPFIDKYEGNVQQEMLYNACKSLPYTKDIFRSLISRGLQFDDHAMDIVCEFCDLDSLRFVLDETRFVPKKRHFKKLATSKNYVGNDEYERRKYDWRWNGKTIERYDDGGFSTNKMELIITYGFKPDYEDVCFGAKNRVEIPNIARFDINPDKKLLEICWDNDFYPSYKFDCISQDMVELQKLCKTKQQKGITELITSKSLVPDRKCMENACCFKNNGPILDKLEKYGGKYSIKCIENCAKDFKANDTLLRIIKKFKSQYESEIEEYKNIIKKLESGQSVSHQSNEQQTQQEMQQQTQQSNEQQTQQEMQQQIQQQMQQQTQQCEDTEESVIDKLKSEILDESDEELITVDLPTQKSKSGKVPTSSKTLGDDLNDSDIAELVSEIKCVDFSKYELKKPTNLRSKIDIPASYKSYFKKKDDKMSFISLKKELLDKIMKGKWFMNGNQNYIDLPKPLKKKLKLDESLCISVNDLDNLAYLFYSI